MVRVSFKQQDSTHYTAYTYGWIERPCPIVVELLEGAKWSVYTVIWFGTGLSTTVAKQHLFVFGSRNVWCPYFNGHNGHISLQ